MAPSVTTTKAEQIMAILSHRIDDMEGLADAEFFTIAEASKPALCNLLTRLARLHETIAMCARR